jgi:hypothetical protein
MQPVVTLRAEHPHDRVGKVTIGEPAPAAAPHQAVVFTGGVPGGNLEQG